jgi:protein-L-isoaspartate(D-aspartate) O-methyltransferase
MGRGDSATANITGRVWPEEGPDTAEEDEMTGLDLQRQYFSEEIQMCANLRTPALVDALARVPREQFLPAGPWTVCGEGDLGRAFRRTADADPRHVYHNISVAIDADRQLFNGGPMAVAPAIDALGLRAGDRILHIGCGLGYYTALMAHIVGPTGRVVALDVDGALAEQAKNNMAAFGWVQVRPGNGSEPLDETFDAIFVHAGVTHPLDAWLDALAADGRLVVPITMSMPKMGPIGKGWMFLITKNGAGAFGARPLNLLTIYTAIGIRDEALSPAIGAALMKGPVPPVKRMRRDVHDPSPACWLHGPTSCFGT